MKYSFFLLITLLGHLVTYAQSRDSLYFIRLKDGSTLYSNKVQLKNTFGGKYLVLDNNKQIPLSQAKEFKGWDGTFAVGYRHGDYDAYKLQNEGRRISLFSQCYYTTETVYASATPDGVRTPTTITSREKALFFRKEPDGDIEPLTYHNLNIAIADDSNATHELRIARTNVYLGVGMLAAGLGLFATGIITTIHHNNQAENAYTQASAEWYAESTAHPWSNTPMPAAPHYEGLSALSFVGMAMSFSAIIPFANTGKHARRALAIYNGID